MFRTALMTLSLLLTLPLPTDAQARAAQGGGGGRRVQVNGMQMYYEVSGLGGGEPATAHTAVITQPDLLLAFIEPFLKGVTPKGMFEQGDR